MSYSDKAFDNVTGYLEDVIAHFDRYCLSDPRTLSRGAIALHYMRTYGSFLSLEECFYGRHNLQADAIASFDEAFQIQYDRSLKAAREARECYVEQFGQPLDESWWKLFTE